MTSKGRYVLKAFLFQKSKQSGRFSDNSWLEYLVVS